MKKVTKNLALQLVLVAAAGFSASASAQTAYWGDGPSANKWSIGAAYYLPDLETQVVVTDAEGIVGTGINFEKSLGLDDNKGTGLAYIDWRMFKRHSLEYRFFQLDRSSATDGSSVAIGIGDEILDIDLPINSFFDVTAHEIAYDYSLIMDDKKELSIGAGISIQDLAFGIQGTVASPTEGEQLSTSLDSTAPLPTLNLGFNYAFNEKWMFVSRLGWLAVALDLAADEEISGRIINATQVSSGTCQKTLVFTCITTYLMSTLITKITMCALPSITSTRGRHWESTSTSEGGPLQTTRGMSAVRGGGCGHQRPASRSQFPGNSRGARLS